MSQPQERCVVGYERDYPGSYAWPIYKVKCPTCGEFVSDYGEFSIIIDGEEHMQCTPCGEKMWAEQG